MSAPSARIVTAAPDVGPRDLRSLLAQISALADVEWDHLVNDRPTPAWEDAQRACARFQRALAAGHRGRAQAQLLKLAALLEAGATEQRQVDHLLRLTEQKRRLIETHGRMLRAAGRHLTSEDIGVLVEAVREAAARTVSDPAVVATIVYRCRTRLQRLNTQ